MKDFLRLLGYVWRYKGRLALGVALGVLAAVLNVASLPALHGIFTSLFEEDAVEKFREFSGTVGFLGPAVTSWIERLLANRFQALIVIVCVLVGLKVLQGTSKALQECFTGYVSARSSVDISNDLYANVVDLPVGFFNSARVSQTVSRFTNDMFNVERGLNTIFGKMIREPLNFIGIVGYCFWQAPQLTGVVLLVMPLVALVMLVLGRKVKKGSRRALKSKARLLGLVSESLAGIRIVKAFLGGGYEKRRFREVNDQLLRQNMKVVKADAATSPLVEFIAFVAGALVIIFAGYQVIRGSLRPADVTTMFIALTMALDPLRKLATVNNRFQLCRTGAARVFEYMDTQAEKLAEPGSIDLPPLKNSIRFEHVGFSYDEAETVLDDIDFEVRQGEVIAVVGISGTGKTTLVNLLPRFYEPTSGRILIDGQEIANASLRSLRSQIGLVTQDVMLFDDTAAANIAYGVAERDDDRVVAAARAAHAHEFIERLPTGYDTNIGEGGTLLSGGQRQRLAIARAIYKDPAILILDEATSSLDSESEHLIKEALDEFMQGRTTFVIAHRLATIQRADRIIVLDHGRIQAIGPHAELVEESNVYRGLYQRQFRNASGADEPDDEP